MKALRSFAVRAALPEALQPLITLAMNLRWSWNPQAIEVFRWVDPERWEQAEHDPVRMLGLVGPERLAELADDGPFTSFLASVMEDHDRYLTEARWFQTHHAGGDLKSIAYFSPEFGVSEALPVYSGGLGVLAGDHLKAASDLGIPLVGVGLLYRAGYFRQHLNADGWQQERYPALDPHGMPLTLLSGPDGSALKVEVDLAGARCVAQVWQATVGRVPLLLLDCDVEENDPEERAVTDRLYGGGGGSEHRLRQEIVLGVGGMRALIAAGYSPDVFHSNEGHAGFLSIERMRTLIPEGLSFAEAIESVRASTIFTTHTPVPAGIDVFDGELIDRYFAHTAKEMDVTLAELMSLGQTVPSVPGTYNMAIQGLRLAGRANGVSKLHGEVSRMMFSELWSRIPGDEVPITSITNGVHAPTWVGVEMAELLDRYLSPGWAESGDGHWERLAEAPDAELWRARERARERLIFFVRKVLREQLRTRGVSEGDLSWTADALDPGILTVGFARRFAMYKRGTLLLSDVERLESLLHSSERPVQFVFAGKSHPLDDGGKEMIRQLVHFAAEVEHRTRFVFLEDYDMETARMMVQGVDVWLNNPRRPLEASGTSGMKAALNGALNCSVLDGWWDECYDGANGWAIGTRDVSDDPEYQDRVDASALFDLLEREITPRFYDRSEGPLPRRWVERMRASVSGLGPFVGAQRMVRDYTETFYLPAAEHGVRMAKDDHARTRSLAAWKERVLTQWDEVAVIDVDGDVLAADVGEERAVRATVRIGSLDVADVSVQLAHGRVGASGELLDPEIVEMEATECINGTCIYGASFLASQAGLYGFAVRVIPTHEDLVTDMDLGCIAWA